MSQPRDNATGTVCFVACVKTKRTAPTAAKDLYVSDWFRKARRYVEASRSPWFILSAKYGLVAPDRWIEPYEMTLNRMPIGERKLWADNVLGDISREVPGLRHAVFLAGKAYRELLGSALRDRGVTMEVPMEGLRSGEQLRWLKRHPA